MANLIMKLSLLYCLDHPSYDDGRKLESHIFAHWLKSYVKSKSILLLISNNEVVDCALVAENYKE